MSENELCSIGLRALPSIIRRRGRFLTVLLVDKVKVEVSQSGIEILTIPPEFFEGAEVEDVALHLWCEQKTALFRHTAKISSTFDGLSFGKISHSFWTGDSSDYKIGVLSDRSKIGRLIRFELGSSLSDTGTGSAIVSMMVVIKYSLS